jgi:hypothetical protein
LQVVEYARKALTTGAMMLLSQHRALQLMVGVLLLVTFLSYLVRVVPYKQAADDVLACVCQLAVLVSLLLGLWLDFLVMQVRAIAACASPPAFSSPGVTKGVKRPAECGRALLLASEP